jgi:hypothetical protein
VDRPLISFIDVYWCDAFGTYLQGWAIVDGARLDRLVVRVGSREVVAHRSPRLDILPHYPDAVDAERAGFAAYIPGRPNGDAVLVGTCDDGHVVRSLVELPDHPLPMPVDPEDSIPSAEEFPGNAPDGPILAVGIRSLSEELLAARHAKLAGREVVGFDIHEGFGVDVVGDAHRLSQHFPPHSFAGIYTSSLIEHLSTPWLFAIECAKVLMVGGRMLHELPWLWPTHAQPNDFWRMTPEGLGSLFSDQLGFRTVSRGTTGSGRVMPDPESRSEQLLMPTNVSALFSWIELEKVDDRASELHWPYDELGGARLAAEYPVESLWSAPLNF